MKKIASHLSLAYLHHYLNHSSHSTKTNKTEMSPHPLQSKKSPTLFFSARVMVNESATAEHSWSNNPYLTPNRKHTGLWSISQSFPCAYSPYHTTSWRIIDITEALLKQSTCHKMEVTLSIYMWMYDLDVFVTRTHGVQSYLREDFMLKCSFLHYNFCLLIPLMNM